MTMLYSYTTKRINNTKLFWDRYFACREVDEGK